MTFVTCFPQICCNIISIFLLNLVILSKIGISSSYYQKFLYSNTNVSRENWKFNKVKESWAERLLSLLVLPPKWKYQDIAIYYKTAWGKLSKEFTEHQIPIHFSWLLFFQTSIMPANDIPCSLIGFRIAVPHMLVAFDIPEYMWSYTSTLKIIAVARPVTYTKECNF